MRVRRPVDVARLLGAVAALAVLISLAILDPDFLTATAGLVPRALTGLPDTVLSVANVMGSLAVLGALLVIAVDALRVRRFAVTSAVLSCALALLVALAVALIDHGLGSGSGAALLLGPPDESAGLPVTAAVALVVGSDLPRGRLLGLAWAALVVGIVCALGLGSLTVPSAAFAVLVGTAAALAVRVSVGVLPAGPEKDAVRSVLNGAGWPVTLLRPIEQAAGRVRYAAVAGNADLRITVVDPDWRGVPFARRVWRLLWLRTAAVGRPALSARGQLERQALSTSLAQAAGIAVSRVVALLSVGPSLVMVEEPLRGTPLTATDAADAQDGVESAMDALRRLHHAGLAHGALTGESIVLLPDGRAGFAELWAAQPASSELQRDLDVVALLVVAAQLVGAEGAVAALRSCYGTSPVAEGSLAALLQPLTLPWPLRSAVRGTALLEELRTALSGPGGSTAVTAPRLERLRPRTVITIAGGTLAAHILLTQLSTVGIISALENAEPKWLGVALLASAATYIGSALALEAVVPSELPLWRTTMVQLASQFLTLVTPPAVGHMGLNIRYLQRSGVSTTTAAASVAIKEVFTVIVTVPAVLVCAWLSGVSASRLTLLPSGKVLAVLLAAAIALALAAAAAPTRRLIRRRIEPLVRRTLPQLLATLSDPRRLVTAVVGIVVLNGGYVFALDASLRAFSASLGIPALVVVYLAATTLGSAVPTPGGLGAIEAALVGGLSATGVPVAAALTSVLAFRTATFWLPAPLGWVAFVGLQRFGHL